MTVYWSSSSAVNLLPSSWYTHSSKRRLSGQSVDHPSRAFCYYRIQCIIYTRTMTWIYTIYHKEFMMDKCLLDVKFSSSHIPRSGPCIRNFRTWRKVRLCWKCLYIYGRNKCVKLEPIFKCTVIWNVYFFKFSAYKDSSTTIKKKKSCLNRRF